MPLHTKDVSEKNRDMAYIPKNKPLPIEHGVEPCKVLDRIWVGKNSAPNATVYHSQKMCKDDIEYISYDYLMKWARKYISRLADGCVGQRHALNNLIDMLNEVDDHVPFLQD